MKNKPPVPPRYDYVYELQQNVFGQWIYSLTIRELKETGPCKMTDSATSPGPGHGDY